MSQAQILPTEHFSPTVSLIEGRPATTTANASRQISLRIRKPCALELLDERQGRTRRFRLRSL